MSSQDRHFSAEKIFIILFVATAAEVAWGFALKDAGRPLLWGGLLSFAVIKGWYIAVYFMHLKYEGWIVKGLIAPTPFLIGVIFTMVSPDVSRNDRLEAPIGAMVDRESGEVVHEMPRLSHSSESLAGHADDH
jgi:cytochrome c oxidase subunit IV